MAVLLVPVNLSIHVNCPFPLKLSFFVRLCFVGPAQQQEANVFSYKIASVRRLIREPRGLN